MNETADPLKQLLPPPLCKGDTIGLVAPAGPWEEEDFARGMGILSDLGFEVKFARSLATKEGYLAGSDEHRSALFHEIWRDPQVKAVLSVRGGYGSLRILESLDYSLIQSCPKIFIGFSDITALHSAIAQKTGLVTFHGPMLTTLGKSDKESVHAFFDMLCRGEIRPIRPLSLEILKPGNASGVLAGGNLTTAVHLLATPYETSWQNKIVFLEDTGEAPYRIDRMLTHLKTAGRLQGIKGLILGSFTNCGDREMIWQRVVQLCRDDNFPVWANFPIGHGVQNMIVPVGLQAHMDSSRGVLSFSGPCCRMT